MADISVAAPRARGGAELAALGIVFGDIGTSPLYALRQGVVAAQDPTGFDQTQVLGVLSLLFWSINIVVTLKYVLILLRTDHDGEGGILALLTLLKPRRDRRTGRLLLLFGLLGAATLLGDGVLTPAISVLSAVEGLEVVMPALDPLMVPIAVVILAGVFLVQRFGTESISRFLGPMMLIWFVAIGSLGAIGIAHEPAVLAAIDPRHGFWLLLAQPWSAMAILGAVFLAVTGAEALYADLGQFRRPVIQRAWFSLVLPALLLNYFGQGALLLTDPTALENPFFVLVPSALRMPMLVLATLATIIASQAIITGAFSLAKQAVQLGYLPPMRTLHTSPLNESDIYIGRINAILAVCTMAIVITFGSSASLASAYGIAVSITMVVTTIHFVAGTNRFRDWAPSWLAGVAALLLAIDLGLLAANLSKIADGGWLPLAIGAFILLVMLSWRRGLDHLIAKQRRYAMPLPDFAADPATRRIGDKTAVFLTRSEGMTPLALILLHDLLGVMFSSVIVVTVEVSERPRVPSTQRTTCSRIGKGIMQVALSVGYMQDVRLPAMLAPVLRDSNIEAENVIYIVGIERMVTLGPVRNFQDVLTHIAAFLARNSERDADRFALPQGRTIIVGRSLVV
ncbi:KUP/HAK/KT family potassium transporter [Nitratireductor luteus]|uniref:KUP/HAK/KT family potassium transporter n=1 Tax=Nitratireductor luteus TaxID=2976980 RepID=UPI00223FBE2B|nr:KUP/HAK/KT family potassium transporter [Nitratireductor luteus]